MVIFASEDIGNADPRALQVAVAAAHAVEHVGLPECALNLSQAAIYLALAPKSGAAKASLGRARGWVRDHGLPDIPLYLRSTGYPGAAKLGRGEGYDYPHDHPDGVADQELMPSGAEDERFVELTGHGEEASLRERLEQLRKRRGRPEKA
jgi:putative ATPase